MNNPRYSNGNFRRKMRARFKTQNAPCGICKGKLGEIQYNAPPHTPLSFVIDEIKPVSRWREFGYDSPQAACMDINNLQPAHYICNAKKSNRVNDDNNSRDITKKLFIADGEW